MAAYLVARVDRRWTSGLVAGTTGALVAGLPTFIGFAAATYVTAGGVPTDLMLEEFRRSGSAGYATWAIGDNVGGAVFMLGFVPLLGAAARSSAPGWRRGRAVPT
jgi:hypothetical protein